MSVVSVECRAVLFDLDGVLVDSRECVERVLLEWSSAHGFDVEKVLAVAHGRRSLETVRLIAPQLNAEEEAAKLDAAESTTTEGVYKVAGAGALLAALPRRQWAVVTSGARAVATLRLTHTGLPLPDVFICAEDVQRGKPDPQGYLEAARRLGVPPAGCVVVEDTPAGIDAAHDGGIRSIGVATTYAATALARADHVIRALSALRASSSGDTIELRLSPA